MDLDLDFGAGAGLSLDLGDIDADVSMAMDMSAPLGPLDGAVGSASTHLGDEDEEMFASLGLGL